MKSKPRMAHSHKLWSDFHSAKVFHNFWNAWYSENDMQRNGKKNCKHWKQAGWKHSAEKKKTISYLDNNPVTSEEGINPQT